MTDRATTPGLSCGLEVDFTKGNMSFGQKLHRQHPLVALILSMQFASIDRY
jgi:hypothetical protein